MTDFLIATWEGGGSVGPMITVARKLIARGHRVRVMSDSVNRREAEAVGAEFVSWTRAPNRVDRDPAGDLIRDWAAERPEDGLKQVFDSIWVGPAQAYAEDMIEELQRRPADLVVACEMLFGAVLGCEVVGQRVALMTCNVSLFPMPGVPPVGPGLTPAVTAQDHAVHAEVAAMFDAIMARSLPTLNAARAHFGLAPFERLTEQHDVTEALLLGTSPSFDFAPHSLPDHIRYVGPQIDDPAWAERWESPWAAKDARPLVLVGFSTTFQNHQAVLQRVIDAAIDLPVRLVVTTGDTIDPLALRGAENVQIIRNAPHNAVMREAVIVITHGGHGTVTRALAHLCPLLVIPHGRDQNDNAVRVTARGAGLSLMPDAGTDAIRDALAHLLFEPRFAAAAAALGGRVQADAVASPVVDQLECLAFPQPSPLAQAA